MSYRELAAHATLDHLYSPSGAVGKRVAEIEGMLLRPSTDWERTQQLRAERQGLLFVRLSIEDLSRLETEASRPEPPPDPVSEKLKRAGLRPLVAPSFGQRLRAIVGAGRVRSA